MKLKQQMAAEATICLNKNVETSCSAKIIADKIYTVKLTTWNR